MRLQVGSRLCRATDDLILKSHGSGASISDIVSAELSPYEISRVKFNGPNILLMPKLALMMALLVHELATNAAKYGALSNPTGTVSISWSVLDSILEFHWSETGGPTVSQPTRKGFGLQLLSRALDQFNGTAELKFRPAGLAPGAHVFKTAERSKRKTGTHPATAIQACPSSQKHPPSTNAPRAWPVSA